MRNGIVEQAQKLPLAPPIASDVVAAFEAFAADIDSTQHTVECNLVLQAKAPHLAIAGFAVEVAKSKTDNVKVPVLFERNGRVETSFDADGYHAEKGFVLEVEVV